MWRFAYYIWIDMALTVRPACVQFVPRPGQTPSHHVLRKRCQFIGQSLHDPQGALYYFACWSEIQEAQSHCTNR